MHFCKQEAYRVDAQFQVLVIEFSVARSSAHAFKITKSVLQPEILQGVKTTGCTTIQNTKNYLRGHVSKSNLHLKKEAVVILLTIYGQYFIFAELKKIRYG